MRKTTFTGLRRSLGFLIADVRYVAGGQVEQRLRFPSGFFNGDAPVLTRDLAGTHL
jgi:hypothetical protein